MGRQYVIVEAWVPERPGGTPTPPIYYPPTGPVDPGFGVPGWPAHPIAPGGPPPSVTPPIYYPPVPAHPIVIPPDAIAPGVPAHPIYLPGEPTHPIVIPPGAIAPGVPTHPIVLPPVEPAHPIVIPPDAIAPGVPTHPIYLPPYVDIGLPGPQPTPTPPIYYPPASGGPPPGIWPSPGHPAHPIVLPPPTPPEGAHPEHPIYYPPVIWPDPPVGYPSIDPDQLPGHPDVPDMNRGIWTWLQEGDALVRAFAVPTYYVSNDLPSYEPRPPSSGLPGSWVIGLFNMGPAWCWKPSAETEEPPPDTPVVNPLS
jgi:hypothetical protein